MPRGPTSEATDDSDAPLTSASDAQAPAAPEAEAALARLDESNGVALVPVSGLRIAPDPGLYAVLGLDPSVSDVQIQTTYRRQAARLGNSANDAAALRKLNMAYEVLGNPVRRAEYDRSRTTLLAAPVPTDYQGPFKGASRPTRRTRPRHVVQPRYTGRGDVLILISVVAVAVAAAVLLILPRLSIDLSALNSLSNVLPASVTSRRAADAAPSPAASATRVPTPTVAPGLADRFAGSAVSVTTPNPAPNTPESVAVRLRRDGQPAANQDVWATVDYRTTSERWPPAGSVKTDANGAATITFNVGQATPGFPVLVHVFTQVDGQQLSWSTSFTPR